MTEQYEVYAIQYGSLGERMASDMMEGGDPHEGPLSISYYVWLCVGRDKTFLVDIGISPPVGKRRKRTILRTPMEGLELMGVKPESIQDIIITHMHYDHVGNFDGFPNARFHLQDSEMAYTTGRHMLDERKRHFFEPDEVCAMVRNIYGNRVVFHDGDDELAPGLSVHHLGGHTAGLQCVRVNTRRGWVVLASDAAHLYAHLERRMVFPNYFDPQAVLAGYDRVAELADSWDHIIPGHDPKVMENYPAKSAELEGIVVRLD